MQFAESRHRSSIGRGSQTSFGTTCKRSPERFPPECSRSAKKESRRRETAISTKRRRRKSERDARAARRSVIYHAPRGSPIVSPRNPPLASSRSRGSSLSHPALRRACFSLSHFLSFSLAPPEPIVAPLFLALAHEVSLHPTAIRPCPREPIATRPGGTCYERPSVPLPPNPPRASSPILEPASRPLRAVLPLAFFFHFVLSRVSSPLVFSLSLSLIHTGSSFSCNSPEGSESSRLLRRAHTRMYT